MPTIKDIAREANVSVMTVSNVIHGRMSHVAPETVKRIRRIIEAYNYTPNMSARSLVNKTSKIIGVINHLIPRKSGSFLQDPFHGAFIGGIERTLRERGYYLMIRTVENEKELFSLFRNWNLDGMILIGIFEDSFFDRLIAMGKPIVLLDSYINNEKIFNIGLEDYHGAFLATEYLLNKGHRSIAFASPPIHEHGVVEERLRGYRDALSAFNISFDKNKIFEQEINIHEGEALGRALAARRDLTAVFATADILAAGILTGLYKEGLRVPEDFSIVGFDDLYLSRITTPPLTTIHQDAEEKGAVAAQTMVDYLEGNGSAERNIIMPVRLVERDSVAPPVARAEIKA